MSHRIRSLNRPRAIRLAVLVAAIVSLGNGEGTSPAPGPGQHGPHPMPPGMGPQRGARTDTILYWQKGKVIGRSITEAGGMQTHFDITPDGEVLSYFGNDPKKNVSVRLLYRKGAKVFGTVYQPNGPKTLETGFENDAQHGPWKTFFPSGQVMDSCRKEHGRFEGTMVSFDKAGHIIRKDHLHLGLKDGLSQEFYESGELKSEMNYKEGRRDGPMGVWTKQHSLVTRGGYVADAPNGIWEEFHPNGQVRARTHIEGWRIVERRCFTAEGRADLCRDDEEEWKALEGMRRAWERKRRMPQGSELRDPMPQLGPKRLDVAPPGQPPLRIAPKPEAKKP